jgi:hypothetical protein
MPNVQATVESNLARPRHCIHSARSSAVPYGASRAHSQAPLPVRRSRLYTVCARTGGDHSCVHTALHCTALHCTALHCTHSVSGSNRSLAILRNVSCLLRNVGFALAHRVQHELPAACTQN